MKTRIVLKGKTDEGKAVLLGLHLSVDENQVQIISIPDEVVTDELHDKFMSEWRNDREFDVPTESTTFTRPLSMSQGLLPDGYTVSREDILKRAQTEWHFVVLSSKLHSNYREELAELKEKIDGLTTYQRQSWTDLKGFWNKVQQQVRERNIFGHHIRDLRKETDELFTKLKKLRASMDEELRSSSQEQFEKFNTALDGIEERITEGLRLSGVMEDLKKLQAKMKNTGFIKEHRDQLWQKLDKAFKTTKQKRFGTKQDGGSSALARVERRYQGLLSAIDRMTRSIKRDKADMSFQDRRIELSDGQLETQLRQAKVQMIEERINSKSVKLEDMLKTKLELEKKIEKEKKREARRLQQQEIEKKKQELKQQVRQEIEAAKQEVGDKDKIKLEEAAQSIKASREKRSKSRKPNIVRSLGTLADSIFHDAIDTAKAVAYVLEEKAEEVIDDVKEDIAEFLSSEGE